MCEKNKSFVVISGNIGAGKSSLARLLGEKIGWRVLLEEVEDYLYVQDFYTNMQSWGFHNQFQFILHKFKQQEEVNTLSRPICQDRSAYECYEVFSRKLFDDGLMTQRDFRCLTEFYTLVSAYLPVPNLIIHLKASIEVLYNRFKQRARVFEQERVTLSYLADLEERYDKWIRSITFCPVLIVKTDQIDYVRNMEDKKYIISRIISTLTVGSELDLPLRGRE